MLRRLSLFFVSFLLLSIMVEAVHHHDDGDDHPNCSICLAHHQQADSGYISPTLEIQQDVAETAYSRPVPAVVTKVFFSSANNRAPPV